MHPPMSVTASANASLLCQSYHPCSDSRCLRQLHLRPADERPVSITTPREGRGRVARGLPRGVASEVSTYLHIVYHARMWNKKIMSQRAAPEGAAFAYTSTRMGGPQNIVASGYSLLISFPLQSREKCSRICSSTRTSCFVVHTATDKILSVSLQCTGRIQSFLD